MTKTNNSSDIKSTGRNVSGKFNLKHDRSQTGVRSERMSSSKTHSQNPDPTVGTEPRRETTIVISISSDPDRSSSRKVSPKIAQKRCRLMVTSTNNYDYKFYSKNTILKTFACEPKKANCGNPQNTYDRRVPVLLSSCD